MGRILNGVRICFMAFRILVFGFSARVGEVGLLGRDTVGETK